MKKITLDPKFLPYFGAIVQAVLFALVANKFFGAYGWVVGLGVGAVVNYSLALASSRYSDIAEKRKPLARIALVIMFLLSPTTITLSLFFSDSIFTAIAWAMCVDVAIILAGAIAGKSLIPLNEPQATARSRSAKTSGRSKPLSGKGAKAVANIPCPYAANGCKQMKVTQNSMNAHAGKCKYKLVVTNTPFETVGASKPNAKQENKK